MSDQNSPHSKHCPQCGSQSIVLDGVTAYWDVNAQDWAMGEDYEEVWCNSETQDCGWSGRKDQLSKETL